MKLTNRLIKTSIAVMFSLYSCSLESVTSQTTNIKNSNISKNSNFSIKGKVQFESFKIKGESEINRRSTVSIIYPADYSDLTLRNTTLATNLTDEQGSFTINPNQNFVPELNKIMILEATKRVNGVGNSIASLRTNIKWNGTKWDSISSPENYINTKTTALSIISSLDANVLSPINSINRLIVLNGISTVNYDVKLTPKLFSLMLDTINSFVSEFKDPSQEIYALSSYGIPMTNNRDNKIKDNMYTYQVMIETYSVDWGGYYPVDTQGLEKEFKDKIYFRKFKNPFADIDPISESLPNVINYSDYVQVKTSLNYKGIALENKSSLKGLVVYLPTTRLNYYGNLERTSYIIYGVDTSGELLTANKYSAEPYYLGNY